MLRILGLILSIVPVFTQNLPTLNIESGSITVGGISAGCYIATQFHFSYSSIIKGNGCLAGGPYWCAQDSAEIATTQCMDPEYSHLINVDYLETIAINTASFGYIDPLINLEGSKVWLYSALNDSVIDQTVVVKTAELYSKFISDKSNIKTVLNQTGEHAQVTSSYGNDCTYLGSPFLNNCGFDAAGEALNFMYGNLKVNNDLTPSGQVYEFSQSTYMFGLWSSKYGLAKSGYIYVPASCMNNESCSLHISFHGCEQSYDDIGYEYILNSGHIPWADANNIVILFPQALANVLNPNGCFDWWGYSGSDYATKLGKQLQTIRNMIDSYIQ